MARASTTSDVFNAIAEAGRREIPDVLMTGEKAVGAIVDDLPMSQPQVSKHLRVLSEVGLVRCRADRRCRLYSAEPARLRPLHDWLSNNKESSVTPNRHGSARIEFPNELEILITREFDAPIALVFDVLTKPEHVSKWGATPPDQMKECTIDLRVGGTYHSVLVTEDGTECSFRGTYLEVEPPIRTVETWLFDGWPNAEAVETMQLHETDGVTTLTMRLTFRDKAGRDHMTRFDGQQDSFDAMEDILRSLLDLKGTVSE